jgi:hypothetical protein
LHSSTNQLANSPSTPTTKSSLINLNLSTGAHDNGNGNLSWFLSPNTLINGSHASETSSPLRTRMEIGIHQG